MRWRIPKSKEILKLALPAIINNITVPLLGLCDTAISGHLGSASYIGAVAVGAMMTNVVYWLCGFLRAGTSGLTAQAWGAGDARLGRDILRKAMLIALAISIGVVLLRTPLLKLLLTIISPEPDVAAPASFYFEYCILAAPAQLIIMACSGWFIGRQNTVVPMIVSVGVNILNILLSLLLVFSVELGFHGIAYGTLLSAWVGAAAIFWLSLRASGSDFRLSASRSFFRLSASYRTKGDGPFSNREAERESGPEAERESGRLPWSCFFTVSSDLFLRSACIMGVSMAMTAVGARLGNLTLAANALMMQFFLFFSYFMDGFAFAGEALAGKALGALDKVLLRDTVAGLLRWGAIMSFIFFLIYLLFGDSIAGILTDDAGVRAAVGHMRLWVAVLPPVTVCAFLFDGIFIGMSRTRPLLVTTLLAALYYFAVAFLVPGWRNLPDNRLLWLAFEGYLLLRGVLLWLVWRKYQMKSLIL